MYRIANVTTLDGKTKKPERIGRRVYEVGKLTDTMSGESYCYAEYADPDLLGKALVTSPERWRLEEVDKGTVTVETMNSIYTFERI